MARCSCTIGASCHPCTSDWKSEYERGASESARPAYGDGVWKKTASIPEALKRQPHVRGGGVEAPSPAVSATPPELLLCGVGSRRDMSIEASATLKSIPVSRPPRPAVPAAPPLAAAEARAREGKRHRLLSPLAWAR